MNGYNLIPLFLFTVFQTMADTLPGSSPYPEELNKRLQSTLSASGPDYVPRTRHLLDNGNPRYINRLLLEDSPYLRQHAHNPVNWYPWGEEAFNTAKAENKLVFLSIGYSTCHWCHVMEHESFEDPRIAEFLNENFISIKVDREQRPDVDEAYMTAVMLINGQGGWPMSSFLTPEGKPVHGGTYYPPKAFNELLHRVNEAWATQQEALIKQAQELADLVHEVIHQQEQVKLLGSEQINQAITMLMNHMDPVSGGLSGAPKFPNEPVLLFLLQYAERNSDLQILKNLEHTLHMMAQGGIYDQIGGGFHRYATDAHWLVPHFEKMLYNQAHLSQVYLLAYRLTGNEIYARTAREILDYVAREMMTPDGAFYSATDADSEGQEGKYFVWSLEELKSTLSDEDAELAINLFGVTQSGNFEGKNILHLPMALPDFAHEQGLSFSTLLERVDAIRTRLRQVREKRIPPLRDDKVIVAWNGMMIFSYAMAANILDEGHYLDIAQRTGNYLWQKQWKDGNMLRVNMDGRSSITAKLDDYAYFSQALIALYDITEDKKWLIKAQQCADIMLKLFWDKQKGGFFMTEENNILFVRPKSVTDGAVPSDNAIAARVLARLFMRTGLPKYNNKLNQILSMAAAYVNKNPSSTSTILDILDELTHGEPGSRQYGARGTVKATAKVREKGNLVHMSIELNIAENWHINSHQTNSKDIIPTSISLADGLTGWKIENIQYPEPTAMDFEFSKTTLDVFHGKVIIEIMLKSTNGSEKTGLMRILPLKLTFQACDDQICLAPETFKLRVAL